MEETRDEQVVTVTGSDGKDIYAPRRDIYVRETNDMTCSGEPMNKSPDAFYDYHFKITRLSREDIILMPFTSETDVFYDSDSIILYRKTPKNRIHNLVEFVEDLPKKSIKKSLGFLDTIELDEIIDIFSGELKGSKKPNSDAGKIPLWKPDKFDERSIDRITNFNPSTDFLEIDTNSFSIDSFATFAAGKNKKAVKKLARQDFYFLYDQKKGGLYFNENGADKGFGDGGIIAILKGAPDLTSDNLEFI